MIIIQVRSSLADIFILHYIFKMLQKFEKCEYDEQFDKNIQNS